MQDGHVTEGSRQLPPGWEAHTDESGPYYWHVPSGTIRREPPGPADQPTRPRNFLGCSVSDFAVCGLGDSSPFAASPLSAGGVGGVGGYSSSISSPSATDADEAAAAAVAAGAAEASASSDDQLASLATLHRPVRYLGWRYLDPDDVARAERSSGAVNRCILALAAAESAGELCSQPAMLELGRQTLRIFSADPAATADIAVSALDADEEPRGQPPLPLLLPPQPLLAIRLWGVGRRSCAADVAGGDPQQPNAASADVGNGSGGAGRHFAYVARDDVGKYVCHVIDCGPDAAAVGIANAVCHRCRRLISQRRRRQQQQQRQRQDLRLSVDPDAALLSGCGGSAFPSPQEEPSKLIPCLYLGAVPVSGPGGLDRLNAAIDAAVAEAEDGRRLAVPVTARVSPSSLRFEPSASPSSQEPLQSQQQPPQAVELRVRYLSFMGVSRASVRHAGFIAQTALGTFECHVCRCEPSCGPLCRTVEAACNLRYQKCLDSVAASPGSGVGGGVAVASATNSGTGNVKTDIVQAVASLFSGLRRFSIK